MKSFLAFCFVLIGFVKGYSQDITYTAADTTDDADRVFSVVQVNPKFNGDINGWLANHIVYPKAAKDSNIQGTVYVNFIVAKDGSVHNTSVIRGVPNGKMLDDEACRVVRSMPDWKPAMQNGHRVKGRMMLPVRFVIK